MLSNVHINCFWVKKKGGSDITNTHVAVTLRVTVTRVSWPSRSKAIFSKKVHTFRDLNHHRTASGFRAFRREIRVDQTLLNSRCDRKKAKNPMPKPPNWPPMVSPNKHTTREAESGTSSTVLGYANFALQCQSRWSSNQIKTDTA